MKFQNPVRPFGTHWGFPSRGWASPVKPLTCNDGNGFIDNLETIPNKQTSAGGLRVRGWVLLRAEPTHEPAQMAVIAGVFLFTRGQLKKLSRGGTSP